MRLEFLGKDFEKEFPRQKVLAKKNRGRLLGRDELPSFFFSSIAKKDKGLKKLH